MILANLIAKWPEMVHSLHQKKYDLRSGVLRHIYFPDDPLTSKASGSRATKKTKATNATKLKYDVDEEITLSQRTKLSLSFIESEANEAKNGEEEESGESEDEKEEKDLVIIEEEEEGGEIQDSDEEDESEPNEETEEEQHDDE